MKILKRMVARCVAGEYMLVPLDEAVSEYKGLFVTTETGAEIWQYLCEGKSDDFIVDAISREYDASEDDIRKDLEEFKARLSECGIISL